MDSTDLIRQAGRTFAGVDHIDASRFRFLNLEDFEPRFGSAWPQARAGVFDRCEAFITRRLGPGDILLRAANGFLVLRAPGHGADPAAFTERLERDLKTFFLGEEHFKTLEVSGVEESINASALLGALSDPALDAAEEAWSSQADSTASPWRFRIDFQPVWCASSQRAALSFAQPCGGEVFASGPMGAEPRVESLMEFDIEVLRRVYEALATPAGPPEAVAVAVPVHFETLSSPRVRSAYAAKLVDHGAAARNNLLLQIVGAPQAAPAGRYAEVAYLARRLSPRVLIKVGLTGFRPERLLDARFDAFILTAPEGEKRLPLADSGFERFRLAVKRLGAVWGVDGCSSADEAQAYLTAGAQFIAGPWLPARIAPAAPRSNIIA